MRYYLIDSERNEEIVECSRCRRLTSELVEFDFVDKEQEGGIQKVWIRQLAGHYFSSLDGLSWKKMAKQKLPRKIINVNESLDLYRGFKPSGLSSGVEGELLTKMPGKVVKIMVKEGSEVSTGDTLLILEAMKMENEVKSALDGVVKRIHVSEGDALEQGVLMMELEA